MNQRLITIKMYLTHYTRWVGPPPEFDRRSVYARLAANKTNTKLLAIAMNL